MKKIQYYLSLLLISGFAFTACENDPKIENFESDKVAFTYKVEGDDYQYEFFYGATISFTNTSSVSGSYTWDFGDNSPENQEASPSHIYEQPGLYNVTLTIEGVGKRTSKILISDIVPLVSYTSSEEVPIIKSSEITIDVVVPNPKELEIKHKWKFPAGTISEDGSTLTESTEMNPGKLKFSNVGSQQIVLETTLGDRRLEDKRINVNIGYDKPAKTLYYAVKGGNLMAIKLINNLPADVKNLPFDLGVKSGQHPFNIIFQDSLLYVLDAGRQFYYVNDEAGNLGDGRIQVVSRDGKRVEDLLSNNKGKAFDDPFFGTIENNQLYYSDRNTGVSSTPITSRDLPGSRVGTYWLENNYLGYYEKGIVYGAIHSNIAKHDGMWWWGKTYGSVGIFRFTESDIYPDGSGKSHSKPTSGIILAGEAVKSFVFDTSSPTKVFYAAVVDKGLYKINYSELTPTTETADGTALSKMTQIAALSNDDEGTVSEKIFICQMALDPSTRNVYFGYRGKTGLTKGLHYYDPTSNSVKTLLNNVEIYGITINTKETNLF